MDFEKTRLIVSNISDCIGATIEFIADLHDLEIVIDNVIIGNIDEDFCNEIKAIYKQKKDRIIERFTKGCITSTECGELQKSLVFVYYNGAGAILSAYNLVKFTYQLKVFIKENRRG